MAPPKFDDLHKAAKDLLNDDFQDKNITFKAKSKTNIEGLSDVCSFFGSGDKRQGATLTTAIDFAPDSKCVTPAKLTFKFPKPLGLAGIAFDKFELDKSGKMKLEAAVDKSLHGLADLKLEYKADVKSLENGTVGVTYTGVSNAFIKAEFKATNPGDYSSELSYAVGSGLTLGVKSSAASVADVGAQYVSGPIFGSAVATGMFTAFAFHGHYKASDAVKVAANYNLLGKANGKFAAGLSYNCCPNTFLKGKLTGTNGADLGVSTSVKTDLAKGVTLTAGYTYPFEKAASWGIQFSIE